MLLAKDNEESLSYEGWIHILASSVGGILEFPQMEEGGSATPELAEHNYGATAGIIAGVIALTGAVWYVRRRRTKAT